MWNSYKTRSKLTIHTTSHEFNGTKHKPGHTRFILVAILILLILTQILPKSWWGPQPLPPKIHKVEISASRDEQNSASKPASETSRSSDQSVKIQSTHIASPLWKKNSVPIVLKTGKAYVAIVIDDMGVNVQKSEEIIDIKYPLTLSFLPYAKNAAEMAKRAKSKGHELMVHIPMEPMNESLDPGKNVLLTSMSREDLAKTIEVNLQALSGYIGINNHMGSKFTQDEAALAELMLILKEKGLIMLDSRTIAASKAYHIASEMAVPALSRDVFLDDDPKLAAVEYQLQRLEKIALKHGQAIAIGHPKSHTIEALQKWLPQAENKGIQVIPLSGLAVKAEADKSAQRHPQQPSKEPEPYSKSH